LKAIQASVIIPKSKGASLLILILSKIKPKTSMVHVIGVFLFWHCNLYNATKWKNQGYLVNFTMMPFSYGGSSLA
jgi:hypothetical protein